MKRDTAKAIAVISPTIAVGPSIKRPAKLAASINTLAQSSMTFLYAGETWAHRVGKYAMAPTGESSALERYKSAGDITHASAVTHQYPACGSMWIHMG
jgi:hypothetical protein